MNARKANPDPTAKALRLALTLGLLFLPRLAQASHEDAGSYGYVRVLDGAATVIQVNQDRSDAEINQPLLAGDRLYVSRNSRLEAVLADRNLARLEGDSELLLDQLAGSPEDPARRTQLRLLDGELQLVVYEDALGQELPRIDTANATVHIQQPGSYLVQTSRDGFTLLIVRRGYAEVLTQRGSLVVREDEQALVEGGSWPRSSVEPAAAARTRLERWGERLDEEARYADHDYLDEPLRYSGSSLSRHGSWVYVDNRPAWQPYVNSGWRPYTQGRWVSTPSGLVWVSSEPWGWVPYHYGTWDWVPAHGWLWYPGNVWSPAWVYWYWTPEYVGWCPTGYYTHHYYRHNRNYRHGFHFGVYGWAGGDWGGFAEWSFLPTHRLRHRDQARWVRPSYALRKELGDAPVPRGLITTDTRGVTPVVLDKPGEALRVLTTRPGRIGKESDLPDVTAFIDRKPLPVDVERQLVEAKPAEPGAGASPLRPVYTVEPEKPRVAERPARGPSSAGGETAGKPQEGERAEVSTRPYRAPGAQPGAESKPGDWRERPAHTSEGGGTAPSVEPGKPAAAESGRRPVSQRPATGGGSDAWRTLPPSGGSSAEQGSGESKEPGRERIRIERRPAPAWNGDTAAGSGSRGSAPVVESKPSEGSGSAGSGSGGSSAGSGRELRPRPSYTPPPTGGSSSADEKPRSRSGSSAGSTATPYRAPAPRPTVQPAPTPPPSGGRSAQPRTETRPQEGNKPPEARSGGSGNQGSRTRPPAEEEKEDG